MKEIDWFGHLLFCKHEINRKMSDFLLDTGLRSHVVSVVVDVVATSYHNYWLLLIMITGNRKLGKLCPVMEKICHSRWFWWWWHWGGWWDGWQWGWWVRHHARSHHRSRKLTANSNQLSLSVLQTAENLIFLLRPQTQTSLWNLKNVWFCKRTSSCFHLPLVAEHVLCNNTNQIITPTIRKY